MGGHVARSVRFSCKLERVKIYPSDPTGLHRGHCMEAKTRVLTGFVRVVSRRRGSLRVWAVFVRLCCPGAMIRDFDSGTVFRDCMTPTSGIGTFASSDTLCLTVASLVKDMCCESTDVGTLILQ